MPFDRMMKVVDQWAAESGRKDVFAQIGDGGWEPRHIPFVNFFDPAEFKQRFAEARLINRSSRATRAEFFYQQLHG